MAIKSHFLHRKDSKDNFLRGKFQCPQKHFGYEKWLWSSFVMIHLQLLFWNSYPLLKVNPTPSCRLELWPSLLDIFHRCCLSMQLFSFCEFFDIKRDPWLGMVMSPFNSVWQVDNSCPSQHFSHILGEEEMAEKSNWTAIIFVKRLIFSYKAGAGAENSLHYIQDMDKITQK